ncbi:hypothetical protein TNCV_4280851 [Trichonephila clavipes]|nr:hypothetical protein TNCV_4280851 [Trichonephila clavipes]
MDPYKREGIPPGVPLPTTESNNGVRASQVIGFIGMRAKMRISFTSTPHQISKIQLIEIQTTKMCNHQCLENGMRWRIVGRRNTGQS